MSATRVIAVALAALLVNVHVEVGAQQISRPFLLGMTPFPSSFDMPARDAAYVKIRDHADLVSHTFQNGVPWPEALNSSDFWTYPMSVVSEWYLTKVRDFTFVPNHPRYVSLQPINYLYNGLASYWGSVAHQPLPAPWDTYRFNHPDVIRAFLNYSIAAVEFFEPQFLAIGVESNILLAKRPDLWADYREMHAVVYAGLKARYPDLTVFVTIQNEHLLGLQGASAALRDLTKDFYPDVLEREVEHLLQQSDLMALSVYPHMAAGNHIDSTYLDTAIAIAQTVGVPLAVEQSGYTTEQVEIEPLLVLQGSEAVQQTWLAFLLQRALEHEFRFVVNFLSIDYARNFGSAPTALAWAYTGLWRSDSTAKPGLAVWDAFRFLPYSRPVASAPSP